MSVHPVYLCSLLPQQLQTSAEKQKLKSEKQKPPNKNAGRRAMRSALVKQIALDKFTSLKNLCTMSRFSQPPGNAATTQRFAVTKPPSAVQELLSKETAATTGAQKIRLEAALNDLLDTYEREHICIFVVNHTQDNLGEIISRILKHHGLEKEQERFEFALMLAQKERGDIAVRGIRFLGIKSQALLIKLAEVLAHFHGSTLAESIPHFGIKDELALIKLAEALIPLFSHELCYFIPFFGIQDKQSYFKLIEKLTCLHPSDIANVMRFLGLPDDQSRIKIATIICSKDIIALIKNFKYFNIKNSAFTAEFYKIAVNKYPDMVIENHEQFLFAGDEAWITAIEHASKQDYNTTNINNFLSFHHFESKATRLRIASILAKNDPVALARYIRKSDLSFKQLLPCIKEAIIRYPECLCYIIAPLNIQNINGILMVIDGILFQYDADTASAIVKLTESITEIFTNHIDKEPLWEGVTYRIMSRAETLCKTLLLKANDAAETACKASPVQIKGQTEIAAQISTLYVQLSILHKLPRGDVILRLPYFLEIVKFCCGSINKSNRRFSQFLLVLLVFGKIRTNLSRISPSVLLPLLILDNLQLNCTLRDQEIQDILKKINPNDHNELKNLCRLFFCDLLPEEKAEFLRSCVVDSPIISQQQPPTTSDASSDQQKEQKEKALDVSDSFCQGIQKVSAFIKSKQSKEPMIGFSLKAKDPMVHAPLKK